MKPDQKLAQCNGFSGWKTWRGTVTRTKCNSMQTQIDNAANVDALAALFTYTTTDGVTSRLLGGADEVI